jgi:ubiquinone/menaquinone biosynthesis C-methylase UbiE
MGVASHLGIKIAEYDMRIRTFIPDYEEMLTVVAGAVPPRTRTMVDIGTGTGALAARCLDRAPRATVVGIDADPAMLELARRRLRDRARFIVDSFQRVTVPSCDVIVSSFALHHIRTRDAKRRVYRKCRNALRSGGRVIVADYHPSTNRPRAREQRAAWKAHLRRAYSAKRAQQLLDAWALEDVHVPLEVERRLMADAGLQTDVLWRKNAFTVLLAER